MLNLPNLRVVHTDDQGGKYAYVVECDTIQPPCGCLIPSIVKNGYKRVMFRDLPMHGKHVELWIDRRRWACKSCKTTFYQVIPNISKKHLMTERLVEYIEKNATERTFSALSKEIGITEGSVRLIFREYADQQLAKYTPTTPRWMGIDELYLLRKFRGIVTNVQDRTIVDLLPNRSQASVARYLSRLDDRQKIEIVTIDMWNPYRKAVQDILPNAQIVVDKFHITRMANDALEKIRKEHRQSLPRRQRLQLKDDRWLLLTNPEKLAANRAMILDSWLANFPYLKLGYQAKEGFRAIWTAKTVDEAMERYDEWEATLPDLVKPAFYDLTTSMKNWRKEIFAHFDHRVTNAYTECLNGLAKIMNRLGRGYSFEVLRAKLLLSHRHMKVKPAVYQRTPPRRPAGPMIGMNVDFDWHHVTPQVVEPEKYLGIDISTLAEELSQLPERP